MSTDQPGPVVRRYADLPVTPWKNGGGVTRELARAATPEGAPLWRVSMAQVASDGPFSHYPGVARTLTVVSGDPLALEVDGRPVRLGVGDVLTFSGDAQTSCALTGRPVEDLGVMVWGADAGAEPAVIDLLDADGARVPGSACLLVVTAGGVRVRALPDAAWTDLTCGDSVAPEGHELEVVGTGRVAVITL